IGSEIKSYNELVVGLPADNQTIVGLARKFAGEIKRDELPADSAGRKAERAKLQRVVRYRQAKLDRLWTIAITKHHGVETKDYLFAMDDGLPTNAIWLKPID